VFVLAGLALLILALDLFVNEDMKRALGWIGAAGMVYAATCLMAPAVSDASKISGFAWKMLQFDAFSRLFGLVFLSSGVAVILLTFRYKQISRHIGEYYMFLVLSVTAFVLLTASVNLLMIYLSIEFVAVCGYVLAAYMKDDMKSQEGALKYMLMGATASAFLVYGISLLFGLTGSLNLYDVARVLRDVTAANHTVVLIAFVFILVGFGYKIAMAPFHFWCPDVYEGAPTPITAFFSVAPKAAGVAVLLRVCLVVFHGLVIPWVHIIEVLAVLTMTIGNVTALWQTNIKRLMAYSSIAHVGYMLIGLVVAGSYGLAHPLGSQGLFAAMIYVVAYAIMNIGTFAVVIAVSNSLGSDLIESYAGLGRRAPLMAVALTVFFLSLAGIPPTVGFIGKFFLFKAAIETHYYVLAIFLLVNSVTSVYYYWNIVRTMFVDEPAETTRVRAAGSVWVVIMAALAAVLALGLFFNELAVFIARSVLVI
jgi:proton-translocating NADH-quinone oxidoreductase chain N